MLYFWKRIDDLNWLNDVELNFGLRVTELDWVKDKSPRDSVDGDESWMEFRRIRRFCIEAQVNEKV